MADRASNAPAPLPAPAVKRAGGSPFKLYKPGQGIHVRWASAVGAGLVAVWGAAFIYEQAASLPFSPQNIITAQTMLAVVWLVVTSWLIFWLVGQHRGVVDFMIATEGEMKKVNWSSRKEVVGATKVVIITVFALGFVLFIVDILFMLFFSGIGVLRIDILGQIFRRGTGQ